MTTFDHPKFDRTAGFDHLDIRRLGAGLNLAVCPTEYRTPDFLYRALRARTRMPPNQATARQDQLQSSHVCLPRGAVVWRLPAAARPLARPVLFVEAVLYLYSL